MEKINSFYNIKFYGDDWSSKTSDPIFPKQKLVNSIRRLKEDKIVVGCTILKEGKNIEYCFVIADQVKISDPGVKDLNIIIENRYAGGYYEREISKLAHSISHTTYTNTTTLNNIGRFTKKYVLTPALVIAGAAALAAEIYIAGVLIDDAIGREDEINQARIDEIYEDAGYDPREHIKSTPDVTYKEEEGIYATSVDTYTANEYDDNQKGLTH